VLCSLAALGDDAVCSLCWGMLRDFANTATQGRLNGLKKKKNQKKKPRVWVSLSVSLL
jgi:hypothetical protein